MSRHNLNGLSLDPMILSSLINVGGKVVGDIGLNRSNRFMADAAARQADAAVRIEEIRARAAAASGQTFKPEKDNTVAWVLGAVGVVAVIGTSIYFLKDSGKNEKTPS